MSKENNSSQDANFLIVKHVVSLEREIIATKKTGDIIGAVEGMKDLIVFVVLYPEDKTPFINLMNEINNIWTRATKIKKGHSIWTKKTRIRYLEAECLRQFHPLFSKLQALIRDIKYFDVIRQYGKDATELEEGKDMEL